jgi:aquaporin Z
LLKASKDRIAATRLNPSQKNFAAEVIGTFIVVVLATGSVVIDAKLGGKLGLHFIAFASFVGVAIGVYFFAKVSMAHFNPAVTLGFLISGHLRKCNSCIILLPRSSARCLQVSL